MYEITIVDNLATYENRVELTQHTTLIDYLQEVYPTGFDLPTKIFDGEKELIVDEFDKPFNEFQSKCIIIHAPAVSVFIGWGFNTFWAVVAGVATSVAISYGIGQLFAPDIPDGMTDDVATPSSSYNLNSKQNVAKLGEPIPIVYGNVRIYPSLVEQPFKRFEANEEYIYQLMCLGADDVVVDKVMVAESNSADLDPAIFTYEVFNAIRNPNIETYIRARFDQHYRQRTRDLPEISRLELTDVMVASTAFPGAQTAGYAGPYRLNSSAAGPIHQSEGIQVHFVMPGGLYNSEDDGSLSSTAVRALIKIKSYDSTGALLTEQDSTYEALGWSNSPVRETFYPTYTVQPEGSWYTIEVRRDPTTPEPASTRIQDTIYVEKVTYAEHVGPVDEFGNVTLLWVKAKASNALANASTFKISAWVHRRNVGNELHQVIFDLYTNTEYGAGLPPADLEDLPIVSEVFNGIFDTSVTVMDAVSVIAKAGLYISYLKGSKILLRKDEVQPIRRAVYNETNIIGGSLKIAYSFGEERSSDGTLVKYRDALTFEQVETTYPTTAMKPEILELLGCTDPAVAEAAAKYGWKSATRRRKTATFTTDVQGMIPQFMDRIGVSHNFVNWGDSGQLRNITNDPLPTLTFDRDFPLYAVGTGPLDCATTLDCAVTPCELSALDTIVFRAPDGSVSDEYTFTVIDDRTVTLTTAGPSWLYVGESFDSTYFTVGTSGQLIRDYLLISAVPNDRTIAITAINYDEEVYQ